MTADHNTTACTYSLSKYRDKLKICFNFNLLKSCISSQVVNAYINECIQEMEKNENENMSTTLVKATRAARTLYGVVKASIHQDCPQHVASITVLAHQVTKGTKIYLGI